MPFPLPGDHPNPGTEPASPVSPTLADGFFTTESPITKTYPSSHFSSFTGRTELACAVTKMNHCLPLVAPGGHNHFWANYSIPFGRNWTSSFRPPGAKLVRGDNRRPEQKATHVLPCPKVLLCSLHLAVF